jgi:hypothetical protein
MKNRINSLTKMGMLLGLTAITALCLAPRVRAGGGLFYATVTNVTQLIADINYANTSGGTFTVNLLPNTTFDLLSVNGSDGYGANLLPIIGVPNAVHLTIHGNGDTLQRDATNGNSYEVRLLEMAGGSSLTLDHMTLQYGYSYAYNGGAIYNFGTLSLSNCTLSGNTAHYSGYIATLLGGKGGAIYNNAGTAIISDSLLSGNSATGNFTYGGAIYNDSGTVTISHSTISGNSAGGGVGGDASLAEGGAIYNNGRLTIENSSSITGNGAADFGQDVYNLGLLYLDGTSTIGDLSGNPAMGLSPVLSIKSWSSTPHQLMLSWSTNYTGFTLQSSTDPGSKIWTNGASPTVSGDSFVVTNSMSAGAQFFRLKR